MTDLQLPPRLSSIGDGAFYGCVSLEAVAIPEGVVELGKFHVPSEQASDAVELWLESELSDWGNSSCGKDVFGGCASLKSVKLPSTLRRIDPRIFRRCKALEEIDTSASPAFRFSNGSLFSSDGRMLVACLRAAGEVVVQDGVQAIGALAFAAAECDGEWSVRVPPSVKIIGDEAFWGCSLLVSASLPSEMAGIGKCAFRGCKKLREVDLPRGLTEIAVLAFCSTGLTAVNVPEGVVEICGGAFRKCPELQSVELPRNFSPLSCRRV